MKKKTNIKAGEGDKNQEQIKNPGYGAGV